MKTKTQRADATTAILPRDLDHLQAKVYEKKFPEFVARTLVPLDTDVDPGAETFSYYQFTPVGQARLIASYANDFPRADVVAERFTNQCWSYGSSFGIDFQEARAARMAGRDLSTAKGNSARRACEQALEVATMTGQAEVGVKGLFNQTNANTVTITADGTGATKTFSTKSPDQVLRDLHAIANYAPTLTNGVETQDTMLMPLSLFLHCSTRRMGDGSDLTILEMFKQTSPYIKTVRPLHQLETAGGSSDTRIVCYRRDPDVARLVLPQDFEQLPPLDLSSEVVVKCHIRTGGVVSTLPKAITYADGG